MKSYWIGASADAGYATLREVIARTALAPVRRLKRLLTAGQGADQHSDQEFLALDDVSFELKQGEVLGVVGRNGAGKSTLLKILSRITEPTAGRIEMRGRVASLLEVGTGFHPELTGRENIFLNGAILGMRHREVQRKFDEIVEFSGVQKFLETPVKRYSSGMRVRLGFAVAAHLDFEILIIDEVLAVGDSAFQKKCLGRMSDVASQGRTVLFVSHNLAVLQRLCPRAIWLGGGRLVEDGNTSDIVAKYLDELTESAGVPLLDRTNRRGTGTTRLAAVDVEAESGGVVQVGRGLSVRFRLDPLPPSVEILLAFYDQHGVLIAACDSRIAGSADQRKGGSEIRCELDDLPFTPGRYRANVAVYHKGELADHIEAAFVLQVHEGIHQGRPVAAGAPGAAVVAHRWTLPS